MSATITDALLSLTPTAQWVMTNANDYNTCEWLSPNINQPTQAQINNEIAVLNANQPLVDCKNKASELLYATDWTTIADVSSSTNNPYLTNSADFIAYRNAVRKLAVTPVANPTWPTVPTAKWSS
jgi:hypothetical protein